MAKLTVMLIMIGFTIKFCSEHTIIAPIIATIVFGFLILCLSV